MLSPILATIGIMCAMPQEAELIQNEIKEKKLIQVGKREFIQGIFEEIPVIFCLAGIGKVSAATTAVLLINNFNVEEIIFTGVAGGGKDTEIGDIVVGNSYLQHDLDLGPAFPKFYIYSLDQQILHADNDRVCKMKAAANRFLSKGISFPELGIFNPKVHEGTILSGDQFICSDQQHKDISTRTQDVLLKDFHAIEMEGAAVAQACKEMNATFIVVRAISDKADQTAHINFPLFIDQVARHYSLGILKEYFQDRKQNEK